MCFDIAGIYFVRARESKFFMCNLDTGCSDNSIGTWYCAVEPGKLFFIIGVTTVQQEEKCPLKFLQPRYTSL